ncbi:MAG: J domain-containing protein [Spongiibacteraceae bacterium]|nr:J domain-containing protein [Spongiibacteraceae bacterium]
MRHYKRNRDDYYRILLVHPDADREIIRASYRTLMQKLKYHPDLGGDVGDAALINEAFSVLYDKEKRAHYDAVLATRQQAIKSGRVNKVSATQGQAQGASVKKETPSRAGRNLSAQQGVNLNEAISLAYTAARIKNQVQNTKKSSCAFCQEVNYFNSYADSEDSEICFSCESPLHFINFDPLWVDKRVGKRIRQKVKMHFLVKWPTKNLYPAILDDLSPTGMNFQSPYLLKMGNI